MAFAILLVYLLIMVNFQSGWIRSSLSRPPAAPRGIVWLLFITGTSISVPALIGSIMYGRGHANSILVVSFAKEQMEEAGRDDGRAGGGIHPLSPGPDDGPGHDHPAWCPWPLVWARRRQNARSAGR
jgi:hypothetical protein